MKTIPLKEGLNSHSAFQIDSLIIEPINLYIQPEPVDDNSPLVQLELKVSSPTYTHTTFLGSNAQEPNTYPKAFGASLYGLDIRKEGVDLLISRLKEGDEFIMDQKEGVSCVVNNLTITYDYGYVAQIYTPNNRYDGYEISHSFFLSDGVHDGRLVFEYISKSLENSLVKEWEGYKIELLNFSILKMRVTKGGD